MAAEPLPRDLIGAAPRTTQDQYGNLIAAENDADSIFFQLIIYATRAEWFKLDSVEEDKVLHRFMSRYRPVVEQEVRRLGHVWEQVDSLQTVTDCILSDVWETVKRCYNLPGVATGSRYVRETTKGKVKRSSPKTFIRTRTTQTWTRSIERWTALARTGMNLMKQ